MKNIIILFVAIIFCSGLFAQTQTIRGIVVDKDSREPQIGVNVILLESDPLIGATTDFDGKFILENVPTGQIDLEFTYTGYSPQIKTLILNSAREENLEIELISGIEMDIVEVVVDRSKAKNPDALVSTISIPKIELENAVAVAKDPGRMAQTLPGVQPSRDNRSDIVIRGNSSVGLLWRLEGIDIPNPNHFARKGSSGGGITIFSTSMLNDFDFSTGAFPAEYGNAFSGVFDMSFRKGNNTDRQYTFKAGILGLDFATEGPLNKEKGSSYLLNYRYSTLGILNSLGIFLVSPRVNNTFQDLSFKLNFPSKNKKSTFGIWGIGGMSSEIGSTLEDKEEWRSYSDRTAYEFETNMGAVGLTHSYILNDQSYIKTTLALMGQQITVDDDTLNLEDERTRFNSEEYINNRISLSSVYSNKLGEKTTMKLGLYASNLMYDLYQDSLRFETSELRNIIDQKGSTVLLQPFVSLRYQPTEKLNVNVGLHSMFLTLNNTSSIEPRLGLQYTINEKQSISAAYGLHGRMLPIGSYFTQVEQADGSITNPNQDLKMIKSHHFVLGYSFNFSKNLQLKMEGYHQRLFNVPVVNDMNRFYWLLNDIDGFASEALVSEGTGTNTGIDIILRKYFSNKLYFTLSGSIYDSKYQALDKSKTFNTQYNSNYAANFTSGKEWKVGDGGSFQAGIRFLFNGGLRITPLDENATDIREYQAPEDESRSFEEQIPTYFRPDLRLAYRKNAAKTAWNISLDVQNVMARRNIDGLNRVFDPELREWVYRQQSSLVPILSFQIDF